MITHKLPWFVIVLYLKIGGDNVCDDYLRDTGRRNNNNNNMQRRYYCDGCVAYIYAMYNTYTRIYIFFKPTEIIYIILKKQQ